MIKYIGICENEGKEVEEQDAIWYALHHCGIRVIQLTEETKEFLEMLPTWYFSGGWRKVREDE